MYRYWWEWERDQIKLAQTYYSQWGFPEARVKQLVRMVMRNIHVDREVKLKMSIPEAREQYEKIKFEL